MESSSHVRPRMAPSLSFSPEDMKSWFEAHNQVEAGAACVDFPLSGADFGELVAAGEGKGALEELGVKEVLQRHKIVKIWQNLLAEATKAKENAAAEAREAENPNNGTIASSLAAQERNSCSSDDSAVAEAAPAKEKKHIPLSFAVFFRRVAFDSGCFVRCRKHSQ